MVWLWLSATIMLGTALTHSLLGERKLITPLLAIDDPLLEVPLARTLVRFAWHLTAMLMLATAVTIVWPGTPKPVIGIIGAIWLAAGLIDGVYTKAQHIGWPMLTLAGVTALAGAM